jgi:cytoskeletal protein RodZ
MRENIEWLIGKYTDKIEELERDAREQSTGMTYITGAIRAYSEVVEDLQTLLDESEDE